MPCNSNSMMDDFVIECFKIGKCTKGWAKIAVGQFRIRSCRRIVKRWPQASRCRGFIDSDLFPSRSINGLRVRSRDELEIMARLKNGNAFVTRRMQDVNQNLIQFICFIRRIANNRTGAFALDRRLVSHPAKARQTTDGLFADLADSFVSAIHKSDERTDTDGQVAALFLLAPPVRFTHRWNSLASNRKCWVMLVDLDNVSINSLTSTI